MPSKSVKKRSSTRRSRRSRCKRGQILRKSYTRKSYKRGSKLIRSKRVRASCIRDRGKSGKGPKLFTVRKGGLLREYGYVANKPATARIRALNLAVKSKGIAEVYRHLRAIATFQRSNVAVNRKMVSDIAYLRQKYYPHRVKSGYVPKKR